MLKQYFTDGLIQIAIVLSLLRTDLNDYISRNYVNYPEVQEIILGQTAAYTQTNFHSSYNTHLGSPEIYRKNIDSLSLPSIYREIRSFRHLPERHTQPDIPTFLLVGSGPNGLVSSQPSTVQQTDNEDENNNNIDSDSGGNLNTISSEDLEIEGQNLLNTLEESIQAIAPLYNLNDPQGSDPTMEDLDLIEVLWRQDIDLGVGKEVFDPNLRRELEREREIELQKERQKQKEQELLQAKAEEQRRHAEQRWLHDNFTQDGETGEWIPLGGNRVPPPPPADGEQYLQNFNEMPMQEPNNGFVSSPQGNHLPPPYQGPPQPIHPHSSQMYNPNLAQFGNHGNQAGFQVPSAPCNVSTLNSSNSGYLHPQSQFNASQFNHTQQTFPQHIQHHSPSANQLHIQQQQRHHNQQHQNQHQQQQQQQQQQNFPRQQSFEATWQDLVNILDLPSNSSVEQAQPAPVNNMMLNNSVTQMDNTSTVLLQNASMPTPAPRNENVTFNNAGIAPVSQAHRSPPHSSGLMSPNQAFNSSMPGPSNLNPVDWDPCQNFLFPNISQSEGMEDVDELLPDLITEDELDEIKFGEIDLSDDVTSPTSHGFSDDGSSESVMSVGSRSIGSPEQNDFSDGSASPFDGVIGATGGHDSPCPKAFKDDPDDYKYSRSCSYSGGDSNSSNFSSSSNDSHGGGPYSNGHGGGHFSPNSNGHINHNHTYPLKPGQDPKDFRRQMANRKGKGPQSKDGKRIQELNVPFTMAQIVDSPVEEFNDMLTRHKLTDQQLQLVRDIRRRGKNKVAAQNCRKRKLYVLENLEDEMTTLEKFRDKLVQERHLIDKQTREMKEKLGNLYSEIFHSLRDEHGRPYDPSRFSLQQSSDGDVFLVPRNYTTEEDIKKKRHDDRKYE